MHLRFKRFGVRKGGALVVDVTVCLGVGRTSLVKDKISKRQLLSFIERTERL